MFFFFFWEFHLTLTNSYSVKYQWTAGKKVEKNVLDWQKISFPTIKQNAAIYSLLIFIKWDDLCDLLPFLKFKNVQKDPWRSHTFTKVAGSQLATLLKVSLLHGCFSRFLDCTDGIKTRKALQLLTCWYHLLKNLTQHAFKFPLT